MYLALYRKYRPQTFDDVISQEHITVTLKNQIKSGQTAHAYLFTGSRGTGKTTCAKILAKAVNCLRPADGSPCLECEACRAIDEGATDVTEIDAASNNGVDSVRGLKEEAVYAPIACRRRVYIIDEVHMLSTAAFNALLKLIEEPPAHVVFIFATTESHKIPATILSRCQRFEFRRIDINDSKRRLLDVAAKEQMTLDDDAAYLISRVSNGGMRDALSLLDQCFSVSGHVTAETVRDCAGISGTEHLFRIADAAAAHDAPAALAVFRELFDRSKSPVRLTEELISHYRTLMLLASGASAETLRIMQSEAQRFLEQNEKYTLESLLRALSILSDALSGMSRTSSEELLFEMCLIRLCTPKLDTGEAALSGRIDALEKLVLDTVKQLKAGQLRAPPEAPAAKAGETPREMPPEAPRDYFPADDSEPAFAVYEETGSAAGKAPVPEAPEFPADLPFDPDPPENSAPKTRDASEAQMFEPAAGIVPPEAAFPTADAYPAAPAPEDSFPPEPFAAESVPLPEPPSLSEMLGLAPPEPPPPPPVNEPVTAAKAPQAEIPEGYEPFAEWKEILEALPFSIRILIADTTAMINGSTVMVCGSELARRYAAEDFSDTLTETVSKAIGRKVIITAQKDARPTGRSRLESFLDFAESQGVNIKKE